MKQALPSNIALRRKKLLIKKNKAYIQTQIGYKTVIK